MQGSAPDEVTPRTYPPHLPPLRCKTCSIKKMEKMLKKIAFIMIRPYR